ncbi:MAG TPA: PspC domain-containing protein [Symbiobacteriaceae bacterium]|nr:PspC domain-containing protein [Symbiobacteriaceae bacterium]
MAAKQLTRSRDKKLMGVAGGIAEYLDMDKTVWRALTIFIVIMAPPMALAYIVLGLVMPDAPSPAPVWQPPAPAPSATVEPQAAEPQPAEPRAAEPQPGPTAHPGPDGQQNGPWQQPPFQSERQAYKPLTKSRDKWLAGVCGGIADYFNVDPVLVRALWLAAAFFFGTGLLLYVILAILLPPPVYQTRV